jgi:hypothetical protein
VADLLPKADWTMFSHRVIFHGRGSATPASRPAARAGVAALCPSYGLGPTDPGVGAQLVKGPAGRVTRRERAQWAALAGRRRAARRGLPRAGGPAQPAPADPDLAPLREAAALRRARRARPELPDPGAAVPRRRARTSTCVPRRRAGPTLVNVWATWCPPCVEEVPDLVAFADEADGRGRAGRAC